MKELVISITILIGFGFILGACFGIILTNVLWRRRLVNKHLKGESVILKKQQYYVIKNDEYARGVPKLKPG